MRDWLRGGGDDGLDDDGGFLPASDARRVLDPLRGDPADFDALRRARLRRGAVLFFLGAMFVAGLVAALVGERGLFDLVRQREEARRLRAAEARLRLDLSRLEEAVERLESDPAARERVARERLDMALPGEIVFLLPPLEAPPASAAAPVGPRP